MKILHTADWQVGKPFAGIQDPDKRSAVRQERVRVIERIGEAVVESGAGMVVVCGDLFDSPCPDRATVAAACGAIGKIPVPVHVIPGNHDHGGAGSLWHQEFFQREKDELCPNLRVHLEAVPVETEQAILFPCPLLWRQGGSDPTEWLRRVGPEALPAKPRIVLAHGSVQQFGSSIVADDEDGPQAVNYIDLSRLPAGTFDYVALGDWHGAKQVGDNAWYSGTPEADRFPKGGDYLPGQVLIVDAERGMPPSVQARSTGRLGWHEVDFSLVGETPVEALRTELNDRLGARAGQDLLGLRLSGMIGYEEAAKLDELIASWEARLLRLKFESRIEVTPSDEELETLTGGSGDPVIAAVARQLKGIVDPERSGVVRTALRELYIQAKR